MWHNISHSCKTVLILEDPDIKYYINIKNDGRSIWFLHHNISFIAKMKEVLPFTFFDLNEFFYILTIYLHI